MSGQDVSYTSDGLIMADNPAFEEGPGDALEPPVHGSYKAIGADPVVMRPGELVGSAKGAVVVTSVPPPVSQLPPPSVQTQESIDRPVPTIAAAVLPPEKTPLGQGDNHPVATAAVVATVATDGVSATKETMPDFSNVTPQAFKYDGEKQILEPTVLELHEETARPDKPYAGMGKEDLLRFSQTPFWNRFRMFCNIVFWLTWLGLLAAVIALTVTYPKCTPPPETTWHETGIFYQIYVGSFFDSDGNGVGDLEGIRLQLPHLKDLKVDALMLSSFYRGDTEGDLGYEVTNHTAVDPIFGTMADFERLLAEAHNMDMHIILDFIPNYTGREHPWFIQSSQTSDKAVNPYWNYYVWTDCDEADDPLVNNWLTMYNEPMWTYNANDTRGQCYLHQFLDTQPDLNLRSSAVQAELEEIMRFWLDKGVDGFKTDRVMNLFEDTDLRDEPQIVGCDDATDYDCYDHIYTVSQDSEILPLVARWRDILDEVSRATGMDRILITDAMDSVNDSLAYYGRYGPEGAHFPLNFQLTKINTSVSGKAVQRLADDFLYGVPTFASADWLTGTQDLSRHASIIPRDPDWGLQNAYTLLKLTMPGVAILYYGEEIGMENVNNTMDSTVDPAGQYGLEFSRDPYRTPMQWTMGENAGFISENATMDEDPWQPVGQNLYNISVEAQNGTSFTPLEFHRTLTEIRNTSRTFAVGGFQYTLLTDNVISYYRSYDGLDRFLVAINFGPDTEEVNIKASYYELPGSATLRLATREDLGTDGDSVNLKNLNLRPGDGMLVSWPYERPDGK